MSMTDTVAALAGFDGRGAGTNAERRAALWLASELRDTGRPIVIETFWCRPNWALAHAWHAGLALAGSLVAVKSATVGAVLIGAALVSLVLDSLTGHSLGRRLSHEHASQNVVSRTRTDGPPITLVVTANYDSGRMGLVYRPGIRRPVARLSRLLAGRAPGWQCWLAIGFIWALVAAILRTRGSAGTTIDVVQLIPTASLVLATAALFELAAAPFGPGANDNASGVALAVALVRALDAAPPRHLGVELVLQGAGDGSMIRLRGHLRRRRTERRAPNTIVLGVGASGAGNLTWWIGDGPLVPVRFLRRLAELAEQTAGASAGPHRGRGVSPAFPARVRGLPAITIGCLGPDGTPPRSHLPSDMPEALDRASLDRALELALTLVDAIDGDVRRDTATGTAASSRTAV
jgi:Peptidase family M28